MGILVDSSERSPLLAKPKDSLSLELDKVQDAKSESKEQSETYGYTLLLLSTMCYCVMTLSTRAATAYHDLDPLTMVFLRGLAQTITSVVIIFAFMDYRKVFDLSPRLICALAVRGIFGGTSMSLMFVALSLAPLGVVTSIFFLSTYAHRRRRATALACLHTLFSIGRAQILL